MNLKASRELDALIAEKVMGWEMVDATIYRWWGLVMGPKEFSTIRAVALIPPGETEIQLVPSYSTDIEAAWEVVESLQIKGYGFILDNMEHFLGNWQAHFELNANAWAEEANSAPLAICRAALKAIGEP